MGNTIFRVISPAKMPDGMADPVSVYAGSAVTAGGGVRGVFNGAVVFGGTRVGKVWQHCTYTREPFIHPGIGQIDEN